MKKKFKLFNTEWKIEYIDSFGDSDETKFQLGNTDHVTHTVTIARYANGKKLSNQDMELTLLHEIAHCIFGTGQYNSCNSDEPLIEWVANCLYSLKKQSIL